MPYGELPGWLLPDYCPLLTSHVFGSSGISTPLALGKLARNSSHAGAGAQFQSVVLVKCGSTAGATAQCLSQSMWGVRWHAGG